jgi:hypothetical protein
MTHLRFGTDTGRVTRWEGRGVASAAPKNSQRVTPEPAEGSRACAGFFRDGFSGLPERLEGLGIGRGGKPQGGWAYSSE